jgi:hypothetical protein
MSSVDIFVRRENIKRYSALLAGESDAGRRATLQALIRAEQTALQEGKKEAPVRASPEHRRDG